MIVLFFAIAASAGTVGLAAGEAHTCVAIDGAVRCWGRNEAGQLGDGTATDRATPVPATGVRASRIAAGARHTCALTVASDVWCWGANEAAQAGGPASVASPSPRRLPGAHADALTAGSDWTCGLRAGDVSCWGFGTAGAPERVDKVIGARALDGDAATACLIDGMDAVRCFKPTRDRDAGEPVESLTGAVRLAVGGRTVCGVLREGAIRCADLDARTTHTVIGIAQAVDLDLSGDHGCATDAAGRAWCWDDAWRARPIDDLSGVERVVVGSSHACASTGEGVVSCWGHRLEGRLGDGAATVTRLPERVPGVVEPAELAVGADFACARHGTGGVTCWGRGDHGQLGRGTFEARADRARPTSGLDDATAIAADAHHACAIRRDGSIVCWGANDERQLGDGTTTDRALPGVVRGVSFALQVSAAEGRTCAVDAEGRVTCWGRDPRETDGSPVGPTRLGEVGSSAEVAAGPHHTCVRRRNGEIACWGESSIADVFVPSRSPISYAELTGARGVVAGGAHSCALLGQHVACWGRNERGQLGNDAARSLTTPSMVLDLEGAKEVRAGDLATCALRYAGDVACWGDGRRGQLGRATDWDWHPASVPGLGVVTALDLGGSHACAATRQGGVLCWGEHEPDEEAPPTRVALPRPQSATP